MTERVRVTLSLPADVLATIDANSTPRTKADFVSTCVRYYVGNAEDDDLGILERIETKIDRLLRASEES